MMEKKDSILRDYQDMSTEKICGNYLDFKKRSANGTHIEDGG